LLISSDLREIATEHSEIHGEVNEKGGREVKSSTTVVYKPGNAVIIESEYVHFDGYPSSGQPSMPPSVPAQPVVPINQNGVTPQAKN
jgi:hypothetical protein